MKALFPDTKTKDYIKQKEKTHCRLIVLMNMDVTHLTKICKQYSAIYKTVIPLQECHAGSVFKIQSA